MSSARRPTREQNNLPEKVSKGTAAKATNEPKLAYFIVRSAYLGYGQDG